MKKHLLLPALAAIALAGCTSSEVLDEGIMGNAIGFTNVVNKPSRAIDGDLTNTNFDNFLVYGYYLKEGMATPIQIFNGVPVHKMEKAIGADGKKTYAWVYNDTRYWVPGCTYFFYAYSCGDISLANDKGKPSMSLFDGEATRDTRALLIQDYTCDADHQHDLVYAENENIVAKEPSNDKYKPANGDVSLKFGHALCKVKAAFTTDFAEGYKVKISNVSISSFYNKGSFNVGTATWSSFTYNATTSPSVILMQGDNYVAKNDTILTNEAFVIPKLYNNDSSKGDIENVYLRFTIEVQKNTGTTEKPNYEIVLERNIVGTWSPQWVLGNLYTYNVNIAGDAAGVEPIVFAAEQSLSGNGSNAWDTSTSLNMVFGVDTNNAPKNN